MKETKTLTIPIDESIERLVLMAIINSINAANELIPLLKADDFYGKQNLNIYLLCQELYNESKAINLTNISLKAREKGNFASIIGDDSVLMDLMSYPSGYEYRDHFEKLRNYTNLRQLISKSFEISKRCSKGESTSEDIIKDLQDFLIDIQGFKKSQDRRIDDIFLNFDKKKSYVDVIAERKKKRSLGLPIFEGVASGYPQLDEALGFFRRSALYYIGARTSMGKTTFIANIFVNMLNQKKKIGFFSLEQGWNAVCEKVVGIYTDIHSKKLMSGNLTTEEFERVSSLGDVISNFDLYIDQEGGLKISQVVARCKRLVANYGVEIIFVDYLTLVKGNQRFDNKHLEVSEISKAFQALAKDLNIPIVCLCQLNRAVVTRNDPSPTIADFRESGSIEEDADACIMLHRPEYYNAQNRPGILQVKIVKNRLMNTLKTIEFSCDSSRTERIFEMDTIEELKSQINEYENNFNNQFKT